MIKPSQQCVPTTTAIEKIKSKVHLIRWKRAHFSLPVNIVNCSVVCCRSDRGQFNLIYLLWANKLTHASHNTISIIRNVRCVVHNLDSYIKLHTTHSTYYFVALLLSHLVNWDWSQLNVRTSHMNMIILVTSFECYKTATYDSSEPEFHSNFTQSIPQMKRKFSRILAAASAPESWRQSWWVLSTFHRWSSD